MKRFILLSFGFLGWAFYELSGGGEFESASARIARLNPTPQVSVAKVDDGSTMTSTPASTQMIDADPPLDDSVTRVSLNLTTLQDVLDDTDVSDPETETILNVDLESGVAVNADISIASPDTVAIIPSLILPDDGGTFSAQSASRQFQPLGDIRTVSGNRVNVRGGPSTEFGVVGRLGRGDAVEIIEDNGNGWVLMRALDGEAEGWMADFLLSSG